MAGFLAFPTAAKSDITLNFDSGDLVMAVARAAIGLIMVRGWHPPWDAHGGTASRHAGR